MRVTGETEEKGLSEKLRECDIILLSERGLTHFVSRIFQRTKKWHHVMLYLGRGLTFEAMPKIGCVITRLNLTRKQYKGFMILRKRDLSKKERDNIVSNAIRLANDKAKFSFAHALKTVFLRMTFLKNERFQTNMPHLSHKDRLGKLTCSNVIALLYYLGGHLISGRHPSAYLLPKDYETMKDFHVVLEKIYDK
ncbi:hypothetical protein HYY73_05710 [Candidatus Woesearchaeota archaeon]|nr:hypothetical protein [Candidatus Woesearchaeota archaeon]